MAWNSADCRLCTQPETHVLLLSTNSYYECNAKMNVIDADILVMSQSFVSNLVILVAYHVVSISRYFILR